MTIALIMHDTLDETPHNQAMWADVAGAFDIPFVYKVGGEQENGFVTFGSEHQLPEKTVCVLTPAEAEEAGVSCIDLMEYVPTLECSYVFGPDNVQRGWQNAFMPADEYVSIETPGNTELFSFTAASMVLWHHWSQVK